MRWAVTIQALVIGLPVAKHNPKMSVVVWAAKRQNGGRITCSVSGGARLLMIINGRGGSFQIKNAGKHADLKQKQCFTLGGITTFFTWKKEKPCARKLRKIFVPQARIELMTSEF